MLELFSTYAATATQSDFFAGGLALGAVGVTATFARMVYGWVFGVLYRRLRASVTLDNRSDDFRYLLLWLDKSQVLRHVRDVRRNDPWQTRGTNGFTPAPGRHWFWADRHLCTFSWRMDERRKVGGNYNSRPMETLTITVFFGNVDLVQSWIATGRKLAATQDRKGPGLHILQGDYWSRVGEVPLRSLDTVLCDDDRVNRLVDDVRWFYDAQDWYGQRGVPWRRGYLLYGPPGTGKSSLIRAVASELRLDIASMDLGRSDLSDENLRQAMMEAPKRALIAIEDVDAVFIGRKSGQENGISFSGLLNAIDGVGAQEGRALIMTTNHRERLDPALIRPGRADLHVELGLICDVTAGLLFARFFPGEASLQREFQSRLAGGRFAPSAIQGWLLENSQDPNVAARATGLIAPETSIAAE